MVHIILVQHSPQAIALSVPASPLDGKRLTEGLGLFMLAYQALDKHEEMNVYNMSIYVIFIFPVYIVRRVKKNPVKLILMIRFYFSLSKIVSCQHATQIENYWIFYILFSY